MNLQIRVPDTHPLLVALQAAGVALFLAPETRGYLVRFSSSVGRRPARYS